MIVVYIVLLIIVIVLTLYNTYEYYSPTTVVPLKFFEDKNKMVMGLIMPMTDSSYVRIDTGSPYTFLPAGMFTDIGGDVIPKMTGEYHFGEGAISFETKNASFKIGSSDYQYVIGEIAKSSTGSIMGLAPLPADLAQQFKGLAGTVNQLDVSSLSLSLKTIKPTLSFSPIERNELPSIDLDLPSYLGKEPGYGYCTNDLIAMRVYLNDPTKPALELVLRAEGIWTVNGEQTDIHSIVTMFDTGTTEAFNIAKLGSLLGNDTSAMLIKEQPQYIKSIECDFNSRTGTQTLKSTISSLITPEITRIVSFMRTYKGSLIVILGIQTLVGYDIELNILDGLPRRIRMW
jgi:hypothetical protein